MYRDGSQANAMALNSILQLIQRKIEKKNEKLSQSQLPETCGSLPAPNAENWMNWEIEKKNVFQHSKNEQ